MTLFLSIVLASWGCSPAAEESSRGEDPRQPIETLDSLLEPIREQYGLPALSSAVVLHGEVIARGAVGLRAIGSAEAVTVDDLWHIGSCTKAFTATLIALLVEEGRLSWATTIGDVFPDLVNVVRNEYLDVTVEQLLGHRSGLPEDRTPDPGIRSKLRSFPGPIQEQRRQVIELVLLQEPAAPAGAEFLYSNFGYLVVGAIAEEVGGESWEEQLQNRIFEPLGMSSAGFGAPGAAGAVTQPRGHREGEPVEPGPLADNAPVIGPAGTIHLSLADWAKFATLHLGGDRGESDFLSKKTFQKLHTPLSGGNVALGWGVERWRWGFGRVLTHAGSNSRWFARIWLAPKKDLAILVAVNSGGTGASKAVDKTMVQLMRLFG